METAIIDYGMGNLLSVQRAFEKCGSDAVIIDNPLELRDAEHIVLPGVGAFPDAMDNLRKNGWIEELNRAVLEKETPLIYAEPLSLSFWLVQYMDLPIFPHCLTC